PAPGVSGAAEAGVARLRSPGLPPVGGTGDGRVPGIGGPATGPALSAGVVLLEEGRGHSPKKAREWVVIHIRVKGVHSLEVSHAASLSLRPGHRPLCRTKSASGAPA